MPRTYVKKKVASYTQDDMAKAIDAVKSSELSLYAASKKFKIPTTTLFDRIKGNCQSVGRPQAIPLADEQRLAHAITIMEKWGWGLSRSDILEIVAEYVKLNNLDTPFANNSPGPDWFINFKKRHGLSIKKPQPIEYVRKKITDPFVIAEYFSLLEKTLHELNLFDKPDLIWNLDETSLCLDPTKTKVVGKINRPCSRTTCGTGRENITVLAAVSASGKKNIPLIVYKGKQMWDQWMAKSEDNEISYTTSAKGWMETTIFYNYLKDILIPSFGEARPVLLIYDGHSTHVDPRVVELAVQNNVTIIKLPPHSSHLLQPLDVAVFKSFKTMWDKKLVDWQRHNIGKKMPKNVFAQTFAETWQQTDTEVIKNGFKKSGIYPFNSNVIPEDLYDPTILQKFKKRSANSQVLLGKNQPKSLITLCIDYINEKFNTNSDAEILIPNIIEQQKKVSFEELLLEKVRQHPQIQPLKKKRIAKGAEVITQNILNKSKDNKDQEKPKIRNSKKSKKSKMQDNTQETENKKTIMNRKLSNKKQCTKKCINPLITDDTIGNIKDLADINANLDFDDMDMDNLFEQIPKEYNMTENLNYDFLKTEWQYNSEKQEQNLKNTWSIDTRCEKEEDEDIQMDILDETTGYIRTVTITQAIVETQTKTEEKEDDEDRRMDILDETTGYIRTVILTNAKVETQTKTKEKTEIKTETKIEAKTEPMIETKTDKSMTGQKTKPKNRPMNMKNWEDLSTTSEDSIMSLHSDSDIGDLISSTDDEDKYDKIKQIVDERESIIFEQIRYLDDKESKAEQARTENLPKKYKNIYEDGNNKNLRHGKIQLTQENKITNKQENMDNKENENENIINENKGKEYDIGDTILARYYTKKNWKYFIGIIIDIHNKVDTRYEVHFYKTVTNKECLKFVKPKRADRDYIPIDLIVKEIEVIQIRENPDEFVLNNEEDKVYF